jgi:Heavy metal binding domain
MKLLFVFSIVLLGFFSCKSGEQKPTGDAKTELKSGPEYTAKYICPMHCEGIGSDTTGQCPKCGMEYVLNKDHKL